MEIQNHNIGNRRCPECDQPLDLRHGRLTDRFYYVHRTPSNCIHDAIGERVHFNTRDEAEKADKIFVN